MNKHLKISIGQYSDKGRKALNQDFHSAAIPKEPQLGLKGAVLAIADGISSSNVSQVASETAVTSFIHDYFCTSDIWSVYTSGQRVLESINGRLFSQTQRTDYRFNKDKGYVCTFSALVFKASVAHVLHIGDSRIYRLRGGGIEALTKDHRVWVSMKESYLSRALGIDVDLELDYQAFDIYEDDIYLLCTGGVYEFSDTSFILETIQANNENLDLAAELIINRALEKGSEDNLTLQIARVDQLPQQSESGFKYQVASLELPPLLQPRQVFDGYLVLRELHASSRSHVYLVEDIKTGNHFVLKIPSVELSQNVEYLERFLMEEWVARRIDNANVMKAGLQSRQRNYLYSITEYIEGQTLAQWLIDNPNPDLATVRGIVEQIGKGLQALHRKEILHQDLRPENIMIDSSGTVKIIDFGSVRVAGIAEAEQFSEQSNMLGISLYSAPEYFIGEVISTRSDLYSLAVITYQLLSGRFPYGTEVAKATTAAAQKRLSYQSVLDDEREIPDWIDNTLCTALQPSPYQRYSEISEFIFDLKKPNAKYLSKSLPPLIERSPVKFWKGAFLLLGITVIGLLSYIENSLNY